jgi:hypothetical protein
MKEHTIISFREEDQQFNDEVALKANKIEAGKKA